MRTIIVYYSMNGNTALAAKTLAERLSADLLMINPEKAYPDKGVRKFLWGGKSAVMAETPKLVPYTFKAQDYDMVILGFPVWASNIAPPIRTFVNDNRETLKDRQIAAFACQSGNGAEKAFGKLEDILEGNKLMATMILIDPKDRPSVENERKMKEFIEKING